MKKTLIFVAILAFIAGTANVANAQVGYGGNGVTPPRSSRAGQFSPQARAALQAASPNASPVSVVGQVLGAATFNFGSNMGVGARGQNVVELQNRLKAEGHFSSSVNSTGNFGTITRDAVMAYQRANGISDTGFVGPLTLARLNSTAGNDNPQVVAIKARLSSLLQQLISLLQAQQAQQ